MSYKKFLALIIMLASIKCLSYSQFTILSGGLKFSSGVDFNYNTSGNPGLFFIPQYKINERFYLNPSLTVFNGYSKKEFYFKLTNYMFHIDLDGQYGVLKEDMIVLYVLGGFNGTAILSRYKQLENVGMDPVESDATIKPGINLGAGIKMYVNKSYDAVLSAKYTAGEFSQFIISLGIMYHLNGNNRKSW